MPLPTTVSLRDGRTAVIRRARPEDAEAQIANFNAIGAERIYLMSERHPRTVDEVRAQYHDANPRSDLWLVAEVGGEVVGGGNFTRGRWSKNAHTADLGVAIRAEFRGQGLGDALMRSGIEWARSVGIRKLKLGVFATNERAIALYRKLGFVEEARLQGEVVLDGRPVDELLMALWL
jgi:RimJ/RimL family protein N-acetyltransferase